MPAFWSSDSPFISPLSLDNPSLIAKSHELRKELGLSGGQLIANPISKKDQIPFETIEPIIMEAVKSANEQNIIAKEVTPFVLSQINQLTKGKSLLANIALIKNNAKLASKIALCF